MRIAFATWSGEPLLTTDDELARKVLARLGHTVDAVPWDSPWARDHGFDVVVVRSTWNYHHACDAFLQWVAALEASGVRVLNAVPLLRWNAHKKYLFELAAAGIRIPETVLIRRNAGRAPLEALRAWRAGAAVIKPAVSANAHRTERVDADALISLPERAVALAAHGDVLVQRLVPEIEDHGEHSVVFFDGAFSHAVLKRARAGEFRVQEKFGGTNTAVEPGAGLLSACRAILAALPSVPTYARLDVVRTSEGWTLMEVELIEPTLFLCTSPGAPERFARAILAQAPPHHSTARTGS